MQAVIARAWLASEPLSFRLVKKPAMPHIDLNSLCRAPRSARIITFALRDPQIGKLRLSQLPTQRRRTFYHLSIKGEVALRYHLDRELVHNAMPRRSAHRCARLRGFDKHGRHGGE